MTGIIIEQKAFEVLCSKIENLADAIMRFKQSEQNGKLSKWLDSQDVCTALDISPRTLQYYRNKGIIPYSYIGNKIYYEELKIASILSQGLITPRKSWKK